jgi:hypothetical protein
MGGAPVKDKEKEKDSGMIGRYREVADYLHIRGLISLTFSKGIGLEELQEFFGFIKQDRKIIREKGGVMRNIPSTPHLKIKEIDYSNLLGSAREEVISEEEKVWNFLYNIADESREGKLPESKSDFMANFVKDSKKSANVLNKVYKEAVDKLQDAETVDQIRETVAKICVYFEKYSTEETKDLKIKLMNVISQLHPDLVNILFEKTVVNEREFSLADDIAKDFSDNFIAEFIESLISNEDTFNENLLKVFDKLSPEATRSSSVVSMVADKLFSKRVINPDTLSQLQTSIKEIFSRHPESSFMEEMHKITVDAVINKKIDTLVYVARLSPMINRFVQSLEEGKLKKEEIWLLLNILWLENDAGEFRKFSEKLIEVIPELLDIRDIDRMKEILEFFTEKIRPEQKKNEKMMEVVNDVLDRVSIKEIRDKVISFIPDAETGELESVAYILAKAPPKSTDLLVDAFITEKNPARRNNFRSIFMNMKNEIVAEVIDRLEYSEPAVVKDLFIILKEYDPEKAHLVSKKLMNHANPRIRWEGLNAFEPATKEERQSVVSLFMKEKNEEVQKKAAAVILNTRDTEAIDDLFTSVEKNFLKRKLLLRIVELCGNLRSQEAFPHLKRIFLRRPLFYTKGADDLRVAAVSSLARLRTPEAMELVKEGLNDKSKAVKKMCEIITKLGSGGSKQQSEEVGNDAAE